MIDRGGTGSSHLDAEEYISGTNIDWRKLFGTLLGAVWVFFGAAYAAAADTVAGLFVWTITGLGESLGRAVEIVLTESAGLQVRAWATAFAQSTRFEVFAPLVMAGTAIAAIYLAALIWRGGPFDG